jgi:hypothetical protein
MVENKTMVKSMLHMARVEKNQWLNQCCLWQGWKKTNGQINVAYRKGGKKPMFKSMVQKAMESQCFSKKKDGHKKSKTTQAEKGINKVKFLCNKKHLTTSTIRYLTLSYFIYSVLQKKRRYLAGDWIPKQEMNE